MNRLQLERIRRENLNKLDTAYRSNLNRIEYSPSESIEHFLAKTICFVLLRNGVPANLLPEIIKQHFFIKMDSIGLKGPIEELFFYRKFKYEWERPQIVCEARFNENFIETDKNATTIWKINKITSNKPIKIIHRRVDLFVLDTGEIIEIETGKSYEKEGENVITVRV